MAPRRFPAVLVLAASLAACGGQGAGDATPIPSTGVPIAAVSARGVDVTETTRAPLVPTDSLIPPGHEPPRPPGVPVPLHDPFAPPVSPPPVPPTPTSTGVPL